MTATHPLPLVGIPADVREINIHAYHVVGEKYINAVAHAAGALPVLIPAFGPGRDLESLVERIDVDDLATRLDGLFLTGSASNVEPHRYGGEPSAPETMHDSQRDATTLALIDAALAARVPLFAVCRGFQELNVALGGTLHQRVHELAGRLDHRSDKSRPREARYGPAHRVRLAPGGMLASLAGAEDIEVNSLHAQAVDRLADRLVLEATASDGVIEAARVADAVTFALGVQWHPEWRAMDEPVSHALFAAFGDAARRRAAARRTLHGRVA